MMNMVFTESFLGSPSANAIGMLIFILAVWAVLEGNQVQNRSKKWFKAIGVIGGIAAVLFFFNSYSASYNDFSANTAQLKTWVSETYNLELTEEQALELYTTGNSIPTNECTENNLEDISYGSTSTDDLDITLACEDGSYVLQDNDGKTLNSSRE